MAHSLLDEDGDGDEKEELFKPEEDLDIVEMVQPDSPGIISMVQSELGLSKRPAGPTPPPRPVPPSLRPPLKKIGGSSPQRSPSNLPASGGDRDRDATGDLSTLLHTLGLATLSDRLVEAELDLQTLQSLTQSNNAMYAGSELEKAGVKSPGHRAKIIAALQGR